MEQFEKLPVAPEEPKLPGATPTEGDGENKNEYPSKDTPEVNVNPETVPSADMAETEKNLKRVKKDQKEVKKQGE